MSQIIASGRLHSTTTTTTTTTSITGSGNSNSIIATMKQPIINNIH
ncbi:hypothetical protein [Candidatus Nitrosocosmicus sp. R]